MLYYCIVCPEGTQNVYELKSPYRNCKEAISDKTKSKQYKNPHSVQDQTTELQNEKLATQSEIKQKYIFLCINAHIYKNLPRMKNFSQENINSVSRL